MAFRGRRDEWAKFLRQYGPELRACGLPEHIVADKLRFFVFLDHGFDQWGWARSPHDYFDARVLTDDQIARLAEFVNAHVDSRYRVRVASRWQRGDQS
jgi:hypothetical protein